jgi:hypothetical protein
MLMMAGLAVFFVGLVLVGYAARWRGETVRTEE